MVGTVRSEFSGTYEGWVEHQAVQNIRAVLKTTRRSSRHETAVALLYKERENFQTLHLGR
jgi:hypothetical protein